jgi:hypothetical protein
MKTRKEGSKRASNEKQKLIFFFLFCKRSLSKRKGGYHRLLKEQKTKDGKKNCQYIKRKKAYRFLSVTCPKVLNANKLNHKQPEEYISYVEIYK